MPGDAAYSFPFEDFGAAEEAPAVSYSQEELEAACAEARAAALDDAVLQEARRQTALIEEIAAQLARQDCAVVRASEQYAEELNVASRELFAGLIGELASAREVEQIMATLRMFFENAADTSRAALKIAPQTLAAHGRAIEQKLAGQTGVLFDVVADDALEPGDARIEWRLGALERRRDHALAQIKSIFQSPSPRTDEEANRS